MKGSTKLLLVLCIAIVTLSLSSLFFNNNSLFIEDASFGEMGGERTYPLYIKNDDEISIDIESKIESGQLVLSIISPENEVVYEKSGSSVSEHTNLEVTKGLWYLSIDFNGGKGNESSMAKNGEYRIEIKLNK
ncbi:hypothetical protein [Clostridium thermarum]|uniref:hypothetical protein n=1 Tax=Clostridium thermarum TaxID=1716543 RepID=UPI0013D700A9|nr:hypothetical protein [Clostridium thermarum]